MQRKSTLIMYFVDDNTIHQMTFKTNIYGFDSAFTGHTLEASPPTVAYFGPSAKALGYCQFFLLKDEEFIMDRILLIF